MESWIHRVQIKGLGWWCTSESHCSKNVQIKACRARIFPRKDYRMRNGSRISAKEIPHLIRNEGEWTSKKTEEWLVSIADNRVVYKLEKEPWWTGHWAPKWSGEPWGSSDEQHGGYHRLWQQWWTREGSSQVWLKGEVQRETWRQKSWGVDTSIRGSEVRREFRQNGPMSEMAQNNHAMTSFSGPWFVPIWLWKSMSSSHFECISRAPLATYLTSTLEVNIGAL